MAVGAILAVGPAGAPAAQGEAEATVAVLEAGLQQWLAEVEFVCQYQVFMGTAKDLAGARAGRLEGRHLYASGRFVKQGKTLRCSTQYAEGPQDVSPGKDRSQWSQEPSDEVSNDDVQIVFAVPHDQAPTTFLNVTLPYDDLKGKYKAGPGAASVINPLGGVGREYHNPFQIGENVPRKGCTFAARNPRAGATEVAIAHTNEQWHFEKTVLVSTASVPPVVESMSYSWASQKPGGPRGATHTFCSDFVPCPGGLVPRRLIYVKGPGPDGTYSVADWVSEDLGQRPPTKDDFVITVPKQVLVRGLLANPPPGTERTIDISKISPADLEPVVPSPAPPTLTVQGSTSTVRWVLIVNGAILALLAGWLWYRSRKAPVPT